jgi:RimK family alpha-L-glutamate ligase
MNISYKTQKPKLAILTQDTDNKSCRLLKHQLEALGAQVDFVQFANAKASDPTQSYEINTVRGEPILVRANRPLNIKQYDGVMLRAWGAEKEGHAALKLFADAGVTMANDYENIIAADSKVRTFERLAGAGVAIPKTHVYHQGENLEDALATFDYPLVIKRDIGSRGDGVFLVQNQEEATAKISALAAEGETHMVLQQFIRCNASQRTLRCMVVNDTLVAVKELAAAEGAFLTNGGAKTLIEQPDDTIQALALKAAKALNLPITGVDIITDERGKHYVLESNDSPMISSWVDEHKIAADRIAAQAFMGKVLEKKAQQSMQR